MTRLLSAEGDGPEERLLQESGRLRKKNRQIKCKKPAQISLSGLL
jgi:hypothetical protein